ncbi:unnamed protein product [Lactuca virosa]|uniref:Uncharacterized protein n=1 Tax=Lactuca virosa TaxID=75947 RepID=A0AAU9PLX3_9ASTR|nr:unnamed protein product [Lactuca virosa]
MLVMKHSDQNVPCDHPEMFLREARKKFTDEQLKRKMLVMKHSDQNVPDVDLVQYKYEEEIKEKGKGKQVEKDPETKENDDIGTENYCLLIESEFKTILECRNRIQKTLEHALQRYPDDRELCGWFERFVNIEKVFNKNIGESSRTREKENENETGEKEFGHDLETEKGEEEATTEREYDNPNFEDKKPNTPNMEAEQKDYLTNEYITKTDSCSQQQSLQHCMSLLILAIFCMLSLDQSLPFPSSQ